MLPSISKLQSFFCFFSVLVKHASLHLLGALGHFLDAFGLTKMTEDFNSPQLEFHFFQNWMYIFSDAFHFAHCLYISIQ